jgi:hypothetical protein
MQRAAVMPENLPLVFTSVCMIEGHPGLQTNLILRRTGRENIHPTSLAMAASNRKTVSFPLCAEIPRELLDAPQPHHCEPQAPMRAKFRLLVF